MHQVGKLLPNDGFKVVLSDTPSIDYMQSLTHLYQPLLGIQAISLFQTLLNECHHKFSDIQTHHTLMNYLHIPLKELYEARLKLEGIGLLKTFKHSSNDKTVYTYELQKPFTPKQFFEDAMLSQLLFHHIGDIKFSQLKQVFGQAHEIQGEDITASFSEVFQTIEPDRDNAKTTYQNESNHSLVEPLDFSWLEVMLKQRMIPVRNVLTGKNKKIISELTKLYHLATYEVEKAVLWALTDENTLDIEEFKTACHDLFLTSRSQNLVRLEMKTKEQPAQHNEKELTKEERLTQAFERMSPRELLEILSGGNQASERDVRMIRDVMVSQGLPAPVMNVLVHYVLIQSNMKLSKSYLETIASHWSRANIKTAQEAMNFARKEIHKYKNQPKRSNFNDRSTEVIPEWFKEREKKRKQQGRQKEKRTKDKQEELEKEEIMQLLKKHSQNHMQG